MPDSPLRRSAGKIGLSTPAVAERVHRLEEAGVITGYHASLDMAKLGVPIRVLVRLTIPGGDLQVSRSVAAIKELAEISRCHRITGDESFVIEANVVSIRHMEALIDNCRRSEPHRLRRCSLRRCSGGNIVPDRSRPLAADLNEAAAAADACACTAEPHLVANDIVWSQRRRILCEPTTSAHA
jgi:DNA-binding Lrp family transcriptional regulator